MLVIYNLHHDFKQLVLQSPGLTEWPFKEHYRGFLVISPRTNSERSFPVHIISSIHSLSCVRLFLTPWTAACKASLSIINSWSLLKLMSIETMMLSSHLILCRPLLLLPPIFPSIRLFSNESTLSWGGQSIGVSASASVLPMYIQGGFSLGWTGWICLQSKGLSRVFSNTTVQKHQFFGFHLSF